VAFYSQIAVLVVVCRPGARPFTGVGFVWEISENVKEK